MTWQWVALILGVLGWAVAQNYVAMLKERTEVAARSLTTLGVPEAEVSVLHPRNGSS